MKPTTTIGKVFGVRVGDDLRLLLQRFMDDGGYTSCSEAGKVLLVRGLYVTDKPSGRVSEPAFTAAYLAVKGEILDVFMRKIRERIIDILRESFQEVVARQGKTVL
jgi:hypothetical protein